jgi:ABC-type transporter Mla subunit MlaD
MHPDDAAALHRVKQAREQRAKTEFGRAQSAELRAAKVRARAEQAAVDFAVERHAQEADVHCALSAGPIPGQRLRQAAAELSELAAQADILRQRSRDAVRHEAACIQTSQAAQRTYAASLREALAVAALQQELDTAARASAEQQHNRELDELTSPSPCGRGPGGGGQAARSHPGQAAHSRPAASHPLQP